MKIFRRTIITLLLGAIIFVIYVYKVWDSPVEAPYPDIHASSDSAVIARGEYLVYGPAHCNECHFPAEKMEEVMQGTRLPLSGGIEFDLGILKLGFPNITPHESGIGKLSDGEIARTLRYSVGADGRYILPALMPFQETSDEDLMAIISYLRSQSPVKKEVPKSSYGFMAKTMLAFNILPVRDTTVSGPVSVNRDSTIQYGEYLARGISNCFLCHTNTDVISGEILEPQFAGGMFFEPDQFTEGYAFISPNLTPDPETGVIANWNQQTFINRFKGGRVYKGSPMPWDSFKNLDETDLKAIYKFLKSLDPVKREVPKTVFAPGEELP